MSSNNPKANEIITCSTSDIPEIIRSHHNRLRFTLERFGHRRGLTYPLFLSLPGVGKSESGYVTATALGRTHFDIRGGDHLPAGNDGLSGDKDLHHRLNVVADGLAAILGELFAVKAVWRDEVRYQIDDHRLLAGIE